MVSLCFADRTFASIDGLVKYIPIVNNIAYLYKMLFFKKSDNVQSFIKVRSQNLTILV